MGLQAGFRFQGHVVKKADIACGHELEIMLPGDGIVGFTRDGLLNRVTVEIAAQVVTVVGKIEQHRVAPFIKDCAELVRDRHIRAQPLGCIGHEFGELQDAGFPPALEAHPVWVIPIRRSERLHANILLAAGNTVLTDTEFGPEGHIVEHTVDRIGGKELVYLGRHEITVAQRVGAAGPIAGVPSLLTGGDDSPFRMIDVGPVVEDE